MFNNIFTYCRYQNHVLPNTQFHNLGTILSLSFRIQSCSVVCSLIECMTLFFSILNFAHPAYAQTRPVMKCLRFMRQPLSLLVSFSILTKICTSQSFGTLRQKSIHVFQKPAWIKGPSSISVIICLLFSLWQFQFLLACLYLLFKLPWTLYIEVRIFDRKKF